MPIYFHQYVPISFHRKDGELFLGMSITDASGAEVFKVVDNEMTYAVDAWDVEFVGSRLSIRDGLGSFLLQVL